MKPQDPQWKVPTGRVRIISAVSDSRLLWGAIELGWVAGWIRAAGLGIAGACEGWVIVTITGTTGVPVTTHRVAVRLRRWRVSDVGGRGPF